MKIKPQDSYESVRSIGVVLFQDYPPLGEYVCKTFPFSSIGTAEKVLKELTFSSGNSDSVVPEALMSATLNLNWDEKCDRYMILLSSKNVYGSSTLALPYKLNTSEVSLEEIFAKIQEKGIRLSVCYPMSTKTTKIDKIIHQGRENEKILIDLGKKFTCNFFGDMFQVIPAFKSPNTKITQKGQKRTLTKPISVSTFSILETPTAMPKYICDFEITPYFKENERFGQVISNPNIRELKLGGYKLPRFIPTYSQYVNMQDDIHPMIFSPSVGTQSNRLDYDNVRNKMIEKDLCYVINFERSDKEKPEMCLFLPTKTFNKGNTKWKLTDKEKNLDETFMCVVLPPFPEPMKKQGQPIGIPQQFPQVYQPNNYIQGQIPYTINSPPVVNQPSPGTFFTGYQGMNVQYQGMQPQMQGYNNNPNQFRMVNPPQQQQQAQYLQGSQQLQQGSSLTNPINQKGMVQQVQNPNMPPMPPSKKQK